MKVPLARGLVVVPRGFLDAGEDDSIFCVLWLFFRPDVPIAMFRFWVGARVEKPRVLVGRVIDDKVDDQANATLFTAVRELDEITKSAVAGIDVVVVGDVVAVVAKWRRLKRHQPDGGDSDSLQVIEAIHQAAKITDAI